MTSQMWRRLVPAAILLLGLALFLLFGLERYFSFEMLSRHHATLAAWVTTYGIVISFTIAGLGVAFAKVWLFWVGMGLVVASLVVGKVLQASGHGQGGDKTRARQSRTGGH